MNWPDENGDPAEGPAVRLHVDDVVREAAVTLYRDHGYRVREIVDALGCSGTSVQTALHSWAFERRPPLPDGEPWRPSPPIVHLRGPRRPLTPEVEDLVRRTREAWKAVKARRFREPFSERNIAVVADVLRGQTFHDIGARHEIGYERVRQIVVVAIRRLSGPWVLSELGPQCPNWG